MISTEDQEFQIVKAMVDSGPIVFPRAIAYLPGSGWTIIVYRNELMQEFSVAEQQSVARWLMHVTRKLKNDYNIQAQWVRE